MSLKTDQVVLLGFLCEGIFQFFARQAEGDIHQRPHAGLGMPAIVVAAGIDGGVESGRLARVAISERRQPPLGLDLEEGKVEKVDGEGRRGM